VSDHDAAGNDSRCILLSATPYNKAYLDLANQIRLFLNADLPLGLRPEEYIRRECNNRVEEFTKKHQCPVNCLAAFEKSEHPDDWRELMRLFMVRRTRSFIQKNYATNDCPKCATPILARQMQCPACGEPKPAQGRAYLLLEDGTKFYFPKRKPRTLHFASATRTRTTNTPASIRMPSWTPSAYCICRVTGLATT
jgi:hypothetical protein